MIMYVLPRHTPYVSYVQWECQTGIGRRRMPVLPTSLVVFAKAMVEVLVQRTRLRFVSTPGLPLRARIVL